MSFFSPQDRPEINKNTIGQAPAFAGWDGNGHLPEPETPLSRMTVQRLAEEGNSVGGGKGALFQTEGEHQVFAFPLIGVSSTVSALGVPFFSTEAM